MSFDLLIVVRLADFKNYFAKERLGFMKKDLLKSHSPFMKYCGDNTCISNVIISYCIAVIILPH